MNLPADWLGDWLDSTPQEGAVYAHNLVTERSRPADLALDLARMIVHAKCDVNALKRLLQRVGFRANARLSPAKTPQLRHGDFGEVLTVGLLERFTDLTVPVIKMRVQMDPDQSLHGTDVVAFKWDNEGLSDPRIAGLIFVESKCRTTPDKKQALKAHGQLQDDKSGQFADTLEFIHQRLSETGRDDLLNSFEEYLARRDESVEDEYRIALIFDDGAWSGRELGELPADDDLLAPLTIDVVLISELRVLIDGTWDAVDPNLAFQA